MKRFARLVFTLFFTAVPCMAQNNVDGFVARVYKDQSQQAMPYRVFIPKGYDQSQKYPLVLWLHGAGSVGRDNLKQISSASRPGTHIWTTPENQAKHPAFVVAPQCPQNVGCWDDGRTNEPGPHLLLVLKILESLRTEFSIDSERIYVAGQSMGGYGTWDLITKRPDLFAAAVPLCGGGNVALAAAIRKMPIWAFHGDVDPTVPVEQSRTMIAAIQKAGGNPRYTEYKGVGHNVWERAFKEPGLVDWLFSQRK